MNKAKTILIYALYLILLNGTVRMDLMTYKRVPDLGNAGRVAAEMRKLANIQIARMLGGSALDPVGDLTLGVSEVPMPEPVDIGQRLRESFQDSRGSNQPAFFLSDSEIPQMIDYMEKRHTIIDRSAIEESQQILDVLRWAEPE